MGVLSLDETLSEICPHCGREHEARFFSLFLNGWHYVVGDCSHCNYRIEFRCDHLGGGLFLPDGSPATQLFEKNTRHLKEVVDREPGTRAVRPSFAGRSCRILR